MKAIDDYINGNLSDAKRGARKAGRTKVCRALLEDYGYTREQMFLITEWMFNGLPFQKLCERLIQLEAKQ